MEHAFSWEGRRVFLTGATGFIGRWLFEALIGRGARVRCLVRPGNAEGATSQMIIRVGGDVFAGNIQDVDSLRRGISEWKTEAVFHLAAINSNFGAEVSPFAIFETNTGGVYNILEACRLQKSVERIVLASSSEVEAVASGMIASGGLASMHPYQVSKMAAELIGQSFAKTHGLPLAIARSDNIYGGADLNWRRLIPGTIMALMQGNAPVLRSDGSARRDYLFITDMVAAYLAIAERLDNPAVRGGVFHFATGISTTALEVVMKLCALMGREDLAPVIKNYSPNERTDGLRSPGRELQLLGWKSARDLDQGLEETVEWYRSHPQSS